LTMCRLTSRAYEHWRGLLRVRAQLSEISGQLTSISIVDVDVTTRSTAILTV